MTAALLKLLGPQLPRVCLMALEQAIVVAHQQEQCASHIAPASGWRQLAAAYERASVATGNA